MKKLKPYVPSAIAVLTALFVSVFLIEDTIVIFSCLAVALVGLATAIVRCIYTKRSRWRALGLTITPVILFVAIAWFHIPVRLIFRVYRARFDQVASQIEAGNPPATPFWIGPYKIEMAGRRGETGTPYVCRNQDSGEITGFVKHPAGDGFNIWSCITLDDAWSYIAED